MALSNIFIEPRREITESTVGIGLSIIPLCLFGWVTYKVALTIRDNVPFGVKLFLAAIITAMASVIVVAIVAGFFVATHAIGDGLCNALEKRGFQIRPKERYRRNCEGTIVRSN